MTDLTESRKRHGEIAWTDRDGVYSRVIGFDETHLEQPKAPEDAVAMVSLGQHRIEHVKSMGREREKKWIELTEGVYLTADQAIETALLLLESAARWRAEQNPEGPPTGPVADDDPRRWELHVNACSISDMTFWVRKGDDGYTATEVETGVTAAPAPTEREALENYWERRFA
jgi:hypothetical protein